MVVEKTLEGKMDDQYLLFLFNIACNEPITTKFQQGIEEVKYSEDSPRPRATIMPKFNETTMDFMDILILIAKKGKKKLRVVNTICDTITYLFQDETNRVKFEQRYGKHLFSSIKF